MKVAIIGAGSTGHALAAEMSQKGCTVTLYEEPENAARLDWVKKEGGIILKGPVEEGFVKIKSVTTSIEEALSDAELIIVAVVAQRHEKIAKLCAAHLEKGQMVIISQGGAGSLVFHQQLKNAAGAATVSELEGNFYTCRLKGPVVDIIQAPKHYHLAAFPSARTNDVIKACQNIFVFKPATNVLEAALNSPNLIVHLAGSVLNTAAIENSKGAFQLFKEGLSASVLKCMKQVYLEKLTLFNKLGYQDRFNWSFLEQLIDPEKYPYHERFRQLDGPGDFDHRYVTEDALTGLPLLISLGEMLGLSVPLSKALLQLVSTIKEIDYFALGRHVKNLSLSNMDAMQLNEYLKTGCF